MFTQCSSCLTLYRVSPGHLRVAAGQVRCCLCGTTFDALASLCERLPPGLAAEYPQRAEAKAPAPVRRPLQDLGEELDAPTYETSLDAALKPDGFALARYLPDHTWRWAGLGLLLTVVLLVQYAYVARDDLAAYPALRPLLGGLCTLADCTLPLRKDLAQVRLIDRKVMPHPTRRGAVLVEAQLRNEAQFRQPFPQLRLSLFDRTGRRTADRWFTPGEYLIEALPEAELAAGMPLGQPVRVRLELADPGGGSENFEFDFR